MQTLFPTVRLPAEPKPNRHQRRVAHKREPRYSKEWEKKAKRMAYTPPMATNQETKYRHQHWEAKRRQVRHALTKSGTTATALDAFDQCGAECVVEYCKAEQRYRLRGSFCHNRHCEPCQKAKANLLSANLRNRLADRKEGQYRFITLTLRHTDTPLRDQIDRLYASFRKLRALPMWKKTQKGGCAILEVKWDANTGEWHPHLHVIAEGNFIEQRELSQAWHACTGDSKIVDIRTLSSENDAAHYVSKYVSKGTNTEVWYNEGAAIEWCCAMKGTRTAATYGCWRGFALLAHNEDKKEWHRVALLRTIIDNADSGDIVYIRMLDAITRDTQFNPHKPRTKKASISTQPKPPPL